MKSSLLKKTFVFVITMFASSSAFAQVGSTDPNNPKPLATNTITGKLNEKKAVYYYSFTGGPGTITLTAEGKANIYSCIVEAYLIDANGKEIGLVQITPDTGGQTKTITRNLDSQQKMTLRVELDRVASDSVDWKITLGGAVSLGMAAQPKPPIKIPGKKDDTNKNTGVKIKIPGASDEQKLPIKIPGKKDDANKNAGVKVKIPGKSETPNSGQTPSLINLFKLTPQQSYNGSASLEFYSPYQLFAKDGVAKFHVEKSQQPKIVLKFTGEPGTYRFFVDVEKVKEAKGTNNRLQIKDEGSSETFGGQFETFGRQTVQIQVELTTPTAIFTIDSPQLYWNFYSIEVKRLKN